MIADNAALGGVGATGASGVAGEGAVDGAGGFGGFAAGGGIQVEDSGTTPAVLTDDTVTSNQAIGGAGGAGAEAPPMAATAALPGEPESRPMNRSARQDPSRSTIARSPSTPHWAAPSGAAGTGGGSAGNGGDTVGGGVDIQDDDDPDFLNDTVVSNTALGGSGQSSGSAFGGGFDVSDFNGSTSFVNVTVTANTVQPGAIPAGGTSGTAQGGGINNNGGTALTVAKHVGCREHGRFGRFGQSCCGQWPRLFRCGRGHRRQRDRRCDRLHRFRRYQRRPVSGFALHAESRTAAKQWR